MATTANEGNLKTPSRVSGARLECHLTAQLMIEDACERLRRKKLRFSSFGLPAEDEV